MASVVCRWCKKKIGSQDRAKMVTIRRQPDGSDAIEVPPENIEVSGPPVGVGHYRCYRVQRDHGWKGDPALKGAVPTVYDEDVDTRALADAADEARLNPRSEVEDWRDQATADLEDLT